MGVAPAEMEIMGMIQAPENDAWLQPEEEALDLSTYAEARIVMTVAPVRRIDQAGPRRCFPTAGPGSLDCPGGQAKRSGRRPWQRLRRVQSRPGT